KFWRFLDNLSVAKELKYIIYHLRLTGYIGENDIKIQDIYKDIINNKSAEDSVSIDRALLITLLFLSPDWNTDDKEFSIAINNIFANQELNPEAFLKVGMVALQMILDHYPEKIHYENTIKIIKIFQSHLLKSFVGNEFYISEMYILYARILVKFLDKFEADKDLFLDVLHMLDTVVIPYCRSKFSRYNQLDMHLLRDPLANRLKQFLKPKRNTSY
ncbi:MAG: hypothetical protein K2X39_01585, partial [Silvanigrellaceae bacterium]|nr:hypothetical protein [Silvanigrellaceae bacterium]